MTSLDDGMHRLVRILEAYLDGRMTHTEAGDAAVSELADLEEQVQRSPREDPNAGLFVRAFWAVEQLREPSRQRTRTDEIRYLLSCLRGEAEYDEAQANAFYDREDG